MKNKDIIFILHGTHFLKIILDWFNTIVQFCYENNRHYEFIFELNNFYYYNNNQNN